MKKLISILLCVAMVLSLAAVTFAEETTPTVNEYPQEGYNYMLIPHEEATSGKYDVSFIAERDGTYIIEKGSNGTLYLGYTSFTSKKVDLKEGEEFVFTLYHSDAYGSDAKDAYVDFTITWTEYIEPHNDLREGKNRIIWDTDWDPKTLEMVVEKTGTYTVTNDMPSSWDKIYLNDGNSYGGGESKKVYLEAGETLKVKMKSDKREHFELTITYTEGLPQPDGSYDYPYTLPMGELNIDWENSDDIYYVFDVEEDGVLTIEGNLEDCYNDIDGGTLMGAGEGVYKMNLTAGTKLVVNLYTYDTDTPVSLNISFAAGELEPNGSEEYPFPLPMGELEIDWENSDDIYYVFTPEEDGVLTIEGNLDDCKVDYYNGTLVAAGDGVYTMNLHAGTVVWLNLYTDDADTPISLDISFEAGELQPDGTSDFPFTLVLGNLEKTFEKYSSVYYTYTATENGYLIINSGLTGNDFSNARFDRMKKDYDKCNASVYLVAGESITITMGAWAYLEVNYEVTFVPGERIPTGTSDEPFTAVEGENAISMSSSKSSSGFWYTFTAPSAGVWVITVPAPAMFSRYDLPEGAEPDADCRVVTIELAEDEVFKFNVWADYEEVNGVITVALEGGEPTDPETPTDPEEPEELFIEMNWITVADPDAGAVGVFTAPETATYVFTITNDYAFVKITDSDVLEDCYGEVVLDLEEGEELTIMFWDAEEIGLYIAIQEEEPGESENPEGSYSNPLDLPMGDWIVNVSAEDAYDGLCYAFTATEAGTLTITLPADLENVVLSDLIYGLEYVSDGVYALEMEVGDSVTLGAWNNDEAEISFTAQVSFVGANEGGDVVEPDDGMDKDGDMTFVFFAMIVLSMAGMVVLVSKKRSF